MRVINKILNIFKKKPKYYKIHNSGFCDAVNMVEYFLSPEGQKQLKGMKEFEEEYKLRNREKSKQAKYGLFWCRSCDSQLVSDGVKCPVCGKINNPNKIRYE